MRGNYRARGAFYAMSELGVGNVEMRVSEGAPFCSISRPRTVSGSGTSAISLVGFGLFKAGCCTITTSGDTLPSGTSRRLSSLENMAHVHAAGPHSERGVEMLNVEVGPGGAGFGWVGGCGRSGNGVG